MSNKKINISKFAKKVNNNEKIYSSLEASSEIITKNEIQGKNINQKINEIFNSRNYIYKANVVIEMKDKTISKTIIGRNSNYLITNSNELILISDIIDIYYQ